MGDTQPGQGGDSPSAVTPRSATQREGDWGRSPLLGAWLGVRLLGGGGEGLPWHRLVWFYFLLLPLSFAY